MERKKIRCIFVLTGIYLLLLTAGVNADTVYPEPLKVPDAWANTYTPEELGAIQRALWAGNMTLEDLKFRKDYTKAYGCFPIIKDMMADPLSIAPDMDAMVAGIESLRETYGSPDAEVWQALTYFDTEPTTNFNAIVNSDSLIAGDRFNPEPPKDADELIKRLTGIAKGEIQFPFTSEELMILREFIPTMLAWHDVFGSPYTDEQHDAWEKMLEDEAPDYIYQLASKIDFGEMTVEYSSILPKPDDWIRNIPDRAFPSFRPKIIETEYGRIAIGTKHDDKYEGDFAVLIDPGGNDHYVNCRIGAAYGTDNNRIGFFADLGGDDFYDCGETNITLGAAILGVAAFYDLGQGNDRYVAGSCTMGAAMCGIASFYDDGGSDTYEGKVYTQGAAGFGIGVMVDDSLQAAPDVPTDEETSDPIEIASFDNDRYHAWTNSQAFARPMSVAICSNRRGNDNYEAGGVYLDAPLFTDRYQSFSQGFAIGERDVDWAGGIALILDYDGNDRYLGDIYNQGVGYWYSAGFLYDGAGNDTYEMTQYGQGSGIHLAIGGLIDVSGNDSYTMHTGLGTGGSHDFAASVLHDRGGTDQYFGNTSCNGGSLTNSAVIFIDREGNDTYAGRRDGGINFGRPARNFVSIGVLVDLGGNDDYLGVMDNGKMWTQDEIGMGWDTMLPPPPETEEGAAPVAEEEPDIKYPGIINYEGELNQETFDELWDIATRWRVGENRWIVPKAVDRLIAFGPDVLPYVSAEFDDMRSGLALYAFNPIIQSFLETDKEAALKVLRDNLESGEEMRIRIALAVISELKVVDLETEVAKFLDDPVPEMQRRAIATIGAIGSDVANAQLIKNLSSDDEALVKASLEVLIDQEVQCYADLRLLLDSPTITVRETLVTKLAGKIHAYSDALYDELIDAAATSRAAGYPPRLSVRGIRSLLRILQQSDIPADEGMADAISILMEYPDWGVRADAILVVKHWIDMSTRMFSEDDEGYPGPKWPGLDKTIGPLISDIDRIKSEETDPYVLFVANK